MLLKDILIYRNESIKDALKRLDKSAAKVLLVVDSGTKLLGTITDGDVRRHILKGHALSENVSGLYNNKSVYLNKKDYTVEQLRKIFIDQMIDLLPIVDHSLQVVDFITRTQAFSDSEAVKPLHDTIDAPVVIMAGGPGTRLEPFSGIFPKALIPVGEKPVIEIIMDEFRKYGASKYFVILNHKGDMIEAYFNSVERGYDITYIREDSYMGTAGSLKLLADTIDDTFILSNCDVIVKADFSEVVHFHKSQKSYCTVLSSIQHYKIPYGVIEFKEGGEVVDIREKPEYTFTINAGVYVMSKDALKAIPEKTRFDMTELIKALMKDGKMVTTYPVNESDYIDIGQWEEYKKAADKLQHLR